MKDYDVYLFDWDGTLAQTIDIWVDALMQKFEEYGFTATREHLMATIGDLDIAVKHGLPRAQKAAFQAELEVVANAMLPHVQLYPDVKDTLLRLKSQNKKLALLTSSPRNSLALVLDNHELREQFDLIICQEDIQNHKPHPEAIQTALKYFDVPPNRAIMIGDTDKDLIAAQNAGVDCLLFYPEKHKAMHDEGYLRSFKPVHVISAWNELSSDS